MSFVSHLKKVVYIFAHRMSCSLHKHRIHTDRSMTRNSIDLIKYNSVGVFLKEEIDSGHSEAVACSVNLNSCLSDLLKLISRNIRIEYSLRGRIIVFSIIIIKFSSSNYFTYTGGKCISAVSIYSTLDLATVNCLFNKNLCIMFSSKFKSFDKFFSVVCFCYTY